MKNLKLNPVNFSTTIILSGFALGTTSAVAQTIKPSDQGSMSANIVVHLDQPAKPISPDLFGIFFEDLNYAADGGLYAQLVQNRSFEYSSADRKEWQSLTAWDPVIREGGQGTVTVETAEPLNANNPHYAVVTVDRAGGGVGLMNTGFDGIAVKAGDKYDFSVFSRKLSGPAAPLVVQLETKAGATIAQAKLAVPTASWAKSNCILQPIADATDARLILLTTGTGAVAFDEISLFPQNTFHNRPNGLRVDIAQAIVDLHPKFVRFPGGCLVHGDGVANFYHWKDTIGPVEQRKGQLNIWRYHQSVGLGYFEYFQFCEDIGAKPLPVVAAGVCCQNSGFLVTRKYGIGQQGLPMEQMPAYIQGNSSAVRNVFDGERG
jgi:hypothetical protein